MVDCTSGLNILWAVKCKISLYDSFFSLASRYCYDTCYSLPYMPHWDCPENSMSSKKLSMIVNDYIRTSDLYRLNTKFNERNEAFNYLIESTKNIQNINKK